MNEPKGSPSEGTSMTVDRLVDACVEHLENESSALVTLIETLREVRLALKRNDTATIAELLVQQQGAAEHLMVVRQQRQRFRQHLAERLGVDESLATISRWVPSLPATSRDKVIQCRDRVAGLAKEAAALTASNLSVLTTTMQLFGEVLRCLVGDGGGGVVRYTSRGTQPLETDIRLLNQRV